MEKYVIEIWKQTVAVQMHFNEIGMKIRNMAITLLTAIWAVAIFQYDEGEHYSLLCTSLTLSQIFVGVGILSWVAFGYMDIFWYHRLLIGAVKHGMEIEERNKKYYPDLGLALRITKESKFRGVDSFEKLYIYYGSLLVIQVGAFFLIDK